MGRHSAPDDDGDLLVAPAEPAPDRPRPRPRHAAPDPDTQPTEVIDPEIVDRVLDAPPRDVVDADVVDEHLPTEPIGAPAAPRPSPRPAPKRERPGRADLRLLRENSSVRARCAAALLLPFILYTVVLVVISRLDVYLIWIWVPAILGGVLFGAQLDAAHKRAAPPTE